MSLASNSSKAFSTAMRRDSSLARHSAQFSAFRLKHKDVVVVVLLLLLCCCCCVGIVVAVVVANPY